MNRYRRYIQMALIVALLPTVSRAQSGFMPLTDLQIFGSSTLEFRQNQMSIKDALGSPYLAEDFSDGMVLMNQITYDGILLRYDIYNDLFEAKLEQKTTVIDPVKNTIDTIYYAGQKFVRKFLAPDKNQKLSHVSVLFKHENCTLYKKYKVVFVPASSASAYTGAKPAKIDSVLPDYYLGKEDGLSQIKGVKSIADFFQVESKEVKTVIKKQKLRLQDEEDLMRLCSHLVSEY